MATTGRSSRTSRSGPVPLRVCPFAARARGGFPVALDGLRRSVEEAGRLVQGQAAEDAQLDHPGGAGEVVGEADREPHPGQRLLGGTVGFGALPTRLRATDAVAPPAALPVGGGPAAGRSAPGASCSRPRRRTRAGRRLRSGAARSSREIRPRRTTAPSVWRGAVAGAFPAETLAPEGAGARRRRRRNGAVQGARIAGAELLEPTRHLARGRRAVYAALSAGRCPDSGR